MESIDSYFKSFYKSHFINSIKKNSLILFGAGQLGRKILSYLRNKDVQVDYFCDNNPETYDTVLDGLKVISPDKLKSLNKSANIIISSMYYEEIRKQLNDLGFYNIMHFKDIEIFLLMYLDFYFIDTLVSNKERVKKLLDILEDDKSRDVVNGIIKHRFTCDYKYILNISDDCHVDYFNSLNKQYFDRSIIKFHQDETFIDAGAFTGDTLMSFIKRAGGRFNKIYAFEPDYKNFNELQRTIEGIKAEDRVRIYNVALYDKDGEMAFCDGKQGSSYLTGVGESKVKTVKLDNFNIVEPVTFIKMDIEGCEMEALVGAERIIKKYKPKLAISIYHKPTDLWEIPLYIKTLVPEYKIYIRHYSLDIGETVCYAVVH